MFGILSIIPSVDLSFIPLGSFGFAWVLPTVIAIIIGYLIFPKKKNTVGSSILEP